MRIPKTWVPPIAKKIVEHLTARDLITPLIPPDSLIKEVEHLIINELAVEDRLNDEVRSILKKFESEINTGRLDYKKVFDLTKQKLIKERNLIL